jgi:hypothetical protein
MPWPLKPEGLRFAVWAVAFVVAPLGTSVTHCLRSGPNQTCLKLTDSITPVENGVQSRVLTGMISFASPNGQKAEGASDLRVVSGRYDVLLQDADINARSTRCSTPRRVRAPATDLAERAPLPALRPIGTAGERHGRMPTPRSDPDAQRAATPGRPLRHSRRAPNRRPPVRTDL